MDERKTSLTPAAWIGQVALYGLFALALVVAGFITLFSELGLGVALVQAPTITDEQARITVARIRGDPQAAADDKNVETENKDHADPAPFFGQNRKQKIGGVFREVIQFCLRTIAQAFAKPAA